MRKTTLGLLAGAATLMAGAAYAASHDHVMNVALPDGAVMQIHYQGDVAPSVQLAPIAASDPFADMDRMFTAIAAQQQAMLQQVAQMQRAATSGTAPAGTAFHMVQTSTDGRGCTQTVEWSSDGTSAQPKMTQASSGNCDAAKPAPAVPAAQIKVPQAGLPAQKV